MTIHSFMFSSVPLILSGWQPMESTVGYNDQCFLFSSASLHHHLLSCARYVESLKHLTIWLLFCALGESLGQNCNCLLAPCIRSTSCNKLNAINEKQYTTKNVAIHFLEKKMFDALCDYAHTYRNYWS